LDLDEDLHVGEAPHDGLGERDLEIGGDRLSEFRVGVAGDELDRSVLRRHDPLLDTERRWRGDTKAMPGLTIRPLSCPEAFSGNRGAIGPTKGCRRMRARPSVSWA